MHIIIFQRDNAIFKFQTLFQIVKYDFHLNMYMETKLYIF